MNPLEQLTGAALLWSPLVYAVMEALKQWGLGGSKALVPLVLAIGPLLVLGWWARDTTFTVKGAVEAGYTGFFSSLIAMGFYTQVGQRGVLARFRGNGADFAPRGER